MLTPRSGIVHGDAVEILRSQTTLPQDDAQSLDGVSGMMASPVVHAAVEFAVYGK